MQVDITYRGLGVAQGAELEEGDDGQFELAESEKGYKAMNVARTGAAQPSE